MSNMSHLLDARRQADLARDPNHVAAAIANYEAARAAHPRFAATSCSQCGKNTGPGDSGFSHCADHLQRDAERAVLRTVADAVQPRDVSQRPCFDADYGSFSAHWADPRTEQDDEAMTPEQAEEEAAEQILSHAESVADWLAKACDTDAGRMPLDVRALEPVQIMEGGAAMLLAVLMNGDNTQALRALHRLRELAGKHFEREISERKEQLLREVA